MRADRLLSILLQLQLHGRMTSRDLAKRLEVSERTIHRDMTSLGSAGVPVVAVTETLPAGTTDYVSWMGGQIDQLATALGTRP